MSDNLPPEQRSLGALVVYQGRGRPSSFTIEVGNEFIDKMLECRRSIRQILEDDGMPQMRTLMRWLFVNRETPEILEFRQQYARACEARGEMDAQDVNAIADESENDWEEREGKNGRVYLAPNNEAIARSALRVRARMWAAERMRPKKWGPKSEGAMSDIETPIEGGSLNGLPAPDTSNLTDRDRGRRLAFVLAKGLQAKESV